MNEASIGGEPRGAAHREYVATTGHHVSTLTIPSAPTGRAPTDRARGERST
jgi:hypothetical protein